MANKKLENLLKKLKEGDNSKDIEPLSESEAERLSGGTDVNYSCSHVSTCGTNIGCSSGPN